MVDNPAIDRVENRRQLNNTRVECVEAWDDAAGNPEGVRPAHPHKGNSTAAWRSSNCRDGVIAIWKERCTHRTISGEPKGLPWLEDPNPLSMFVARQSRAEPINGIKRARTDVSKRPPMKGNEVARIRPLKQLEGIARSKVTTPKAWLPPWCMANGQESKIELPLTPCEVFVDQLVCMRSQRGVPRKEDRSLPC
jgi:hypothetical protein